MVVGSLPNWGRSIGPRLLFRSNYLAIPENLLDPAHTTFVHARTIGNAAAADVETRSARGSATASSRNAGFRNIFLCRDILETIQRIESASGETSQVNIASDACRA